MIIKCVWEHNGDDSLLYSSNFVGAFTRGASREEAVAKMPQEIAAYFRWSGDSIPEDFIVNITQEKVSGLKICDADSDVIFDNEKVPLSLEVYNALKALALKSAKDFLTLYESVPDIEVSSLPQRSTFYGMTPRTAKEMYEHTKNVNEYYFGEIGVNADNDGTIIECRKRGFGQLEEQAGFLERSAVVGSYGEEWSLRKVLRRFIWHDRIHAKAMYRMAKNTFRENSIADIFRFDA